MSGEAELEGLLEWVAGSEFCGLHQPRQQSTEHRVG
jgi:hypothetical protein